MGKQRNRLRRRLFSLLRLLRVRSRKTAGVYIFLLLLVVLRTFLSFRGEAPPFWNIRWRSVPPPGPSFPVTRPLEPEAAPPPAELYGTSRERCFILGHNGARSVWHMNSRALCTFNDAVCLQGKHLENVYSFGKRGSGSCDVVSVDGQSPPVRADTAGLGESCAAFRKRHVIGIYGNERFANWEEWLTDLRQRRYSDRFHHAVAWHSEFAIIVPKYPWSWNICHYNRIWVFVTYVIRNLHLFAPDAAKGLKRVDVLFRSGLMYGGNWPRGLRESTIPELQKETGLEIRVGQMRFDSRRDFQCIKRGIVLGDEGRVDAFPFLNDTDIWTIQEQRSDSHWPSISGEALWLRHIVYSAQGFLDQATFDGPGVANFRTIPVPPKRIAYLQRSPYSPRHLTASGARWFENTLHELAAENGFEVRYVRFRKEMSFRDQIAQVRDVGVAVGLHGANMVNTMFMPAGSAMFEIFPWRYVRFYYAAGLNSGLRYSYHEPENGVDKHCNYDKFCFMRYRESVVYLSDRDRIEIRTRMENSIKHVADLHARFPKGSIPLQKDGMRYRIPRPVKNLTTT